MSEVGPESLVLTRHALATTGLHYCRKVRRPLARPAISTDSGSSATGIASCIQLLGSVIGIAIAQVILTNGLSKYITPLGLDAVTIRAIKSSVEIVKTLPSDVRPQVIDAYVQVSFRSNASVPGLIVSSTVTQSLRNVYAMAIPAGILIGPAAMLIKRVNVKKMGTQMGGAA